MSKKAKDVTILKGKHLTIRRTAEGKEVFIWDWKKLEKEVAKAISDFEKKQKQAKKKNEQKEK